VLQIMCKIFVGFATSLRLRKRRVNVPKQKKKMFREFSDEELDQMKKVLAPTKNHKQFCQAVYLGLEHGITFEPPHYEELRKTGLGKELF
jgi:hypothetical protein